MPSKPRWPPVPARGRSRRGWRDVYAVRAPSQETPTACLFPPSSRVEPEVLDGDVLSKNQAGEPAAGRIPWLQTYPARRRLCRRRRVGLQFLPLFVLAPAGGVPL